MALKNDMSSRGTLFIGLLFVVVICSPYFILGPTAYINPHDFLDLTIAHFKSIVNTGQFYSFKGTLPIMENIDRMGVPFVSPFELKGLFFFFFPNYWGVLCNLLTVKVCSFLGMYFLLDKYVVNNNKLLSCTIAVLYSMIPFYIDYSLSSAGIPLLVYALLNIHLRDNTPGSFILVLLYAFNSSLSLSGLFVCFVLLIFIIWDFCKHNKIDWYLISALLILVVVYTFINWPLIESFVFPTDITSHRVEMHKEESFSEMIYKFKSILIACQYHAGSFWAAPLILIFFLVLFFYHKSETDLTKYAFLFVGLASLIFIGIIVRLIPLKIFSAFQFDRFYFIYPTLCFVLVAKACSVLNKYSKKLFLLGLLFISFISVARTNDEYRVNLNRLIGKDTPEALSYKKFYDPPLFCILADSIGVSQDYSVKVVSVGLFPAIAEYNGFYCLDGYVTSYPLDYKQRFRKVIASELDKNSSLKNYFDNWGNRCYIFSSELDDAGNRYMCGKDSGISINHLDINIEALKELGCQYIFSAVDIMNYRELNLEYINCFITNESFWAIRVYKIQ